MKKFMNPDSGVLLLLTGPTASGKTTIANALRERYGFEKCLTATTRHPRDGERHGVDYFFVDHNTFLRMQYTEHAFLETAQIHGHWYGTLREPIEEGLRLGKRLVVCIDPQGVLSLMADHNAHLHEYVLSVYLEVDAYETERRFRERSKEFSKEEFKRRLKTRAEEEKLRDICDYRIQNPDGALESTIQKILLKVARRHKEILTQV